MNIFGYILIVVTIILTVFIGIKQPKMHTKLMMYDSQYVLVDENSTPPIETVTKTEELPTMPVENSVSKIKIVMEEQDNPIVKIETNVIEQPKTTTQTKTEVKQNPVAKTEVKQVPTTKTVTKQNPTTTTTAKPVEKIVTKTIPQTKQTQTQKTVPVTKTTQNSNKTQQKNTQTSTGQTQTQQLNSIFNTLSQNVPKTTTKVLTEQEEEVAWNVWRSNLQNKIMKDSKMPTIPIGTVFRMSFDVDKSGKITNIQTWSPDPKYTPYAIEFIAPVIKSYQGKPILDFPEGSKRTKTTFTGAWKMASTSKYSTPNDYNDIEKVKR